MYRDRRVRREQIEKLMKALTHQNLQELIRTWPDFGGELPHKSRLNTLSGSIPSLEHLPVGCQLGPRCPYAQRECVIAPRLTGNKTHLYACHFPLNKEPQ